ncbi:MAG: hypothetical protein IJS04_03705 [Muribaculaceae bacterium]|nr:hypothetical protein [Muribaculaceae bacterium]MBQ7204928.1 hypothetical protein [Muribaculaceae bacterium]
MMKARTIKTLLVAAITMAAMSVPTTANAQLGGLVNKAKKKAEQVVEKKKEDVKKEAKKAKDDAKMSALETQRPPLPWVMDPNGTYNGIGMEEFVDRMAEMDITEDGLKELRSQLDARFKHNHTLDKINSGPDYDVKLWESIQKENERYWQFYDKISSWTLVLINSTKVTEDANGAVSVSTKGSLMTANKYRAKGSAQGITIVSRNGKYVFASLGGQGSFLNAADLEGAKKCAKQMHLFQIFTKDTPQLWDELGEKYSNTQKYMYYNQNVYANAADQAIAQNAPENIEFKAMPKAGSMHAKFKAEALAIAKADDPNVLDVIITSNDWDVVMKGIVPERRNIYGYIVTKDELGKKCSERVWTQKYQGNGNYGKLKAGGVGVSSDFYVK